MRSFRLAVSWIVDGRLRTTSPFHIPSVSFDPNDLIMLGQMYYRDASVSKAATMTGSNDTCAPCTTCPAHLAGFFTSCTLIRKVSDFNYTLKSHLKHTCLDLCYSDIKRTF
jgi:hypothetical protein